MTIPGGGLLRREIYGRLDYHFQFQNELKLFAEIGNRVRFSINIHHAIPSGTVLFDHVSNLFVPQTLEGCYSPSPGRPVSGIKDENGNWNLVGHPDRVITCNEKLLGLLAEVFDAPGTPPIKARLVILHARQVLAVLRSLASHKARLGEQGDYASTEMWHEANDQKAGTIRRQTCFPSSPGSCILSGPHIHVGNPNYQTPRRVCTTHRAYAPTNLELIPDDYLPRTNYPPDCPPSDYRRRIPAVPWNGDSKITDHYRLFIRKMLSQAGERTLVAAIAPMKVGHINGCFALAFRDREALVEIAAVAQSLLLDFWVKATGKSNFQEDVIARFPIGFGNPAMAVRTLLLNCCTEAYRDLWASCWKEEWTRCSWTKEDARLSSSFFAGLRPDWERHACVRVPYSRRQALVEIDVLVAMALGLTVEELCAIYRIQFPVLKQNEDDTWYDRNGRIIFKCSKGLPGVGLTRHEWNEAKSMTSGSIEQWVTCDIMPDYRKAYAHIRLPDGTELDCPCPEYPEPIPGPIERRMTYIPPFDRCDREADYRTAWAEFERRGVGKP